MWTEGKISLSDYILITKEMTQAEDMWNDAIYLNNNRKVVRQLRSIIEDPKIQNPI